MITRESTVVAIKDQVSSDLAGEAVILSLTSAKYYGLDTVGARIWHLIQQPATVAVIRDAITAEYEVEPEHAETSIIRLLNELSEQGLIEEKGASGEPASPDSVPTNELGA